MMNLSTSFAYPFAELSSQLPTIRFPQLCRQSVWGAVKSCFGTMRQAHTSASSSENAFGLTLQEKNSIVPGQYQAVAPSSVVADIPSSCISDEAKPASKSAGSQLRSNLKSLKSSNAPVKRDPLQGTPATSSVKPARVPKGPEYIPSSSLAHSLSKAGVCQPSSVATDSINGPANINENTQLLRPFYTTGAGLDRKPEVPVTRSSKRSSHSSSRATVSTIKFSTDGSLPSSPSTVGDVHVCEKGEVLNAQNMIVFDDIMISSKYTVGEMLGEGAYGSVYKATDDDGRMVALKVIEVQMLEDEEDKEMVKQEAAVQSAFCIPETLRLFGVIFDASRVFYVMELAEMGDLRCYINKIPARTVQERYAAHVIHGVARALFVIHGRKLMHRDIKPGNILLDAHGSPKLGDFGLCVSVCREGGVCEDRGTRAYSAPEVNGKTPYGCAVDMWALGVTTFEILHGDRPFENAKSALRKGNGKIVLQKSKTVSTEAMDFIQCLLHPNPSERLTAVEAIRHPWFQKQLGLVYY